MMGQVVLAVDPGEVRIGLALSDPSATIARPLTILTHISRREDAARIVTQAEIMHAERIIVGIALDDEGEIGPQARKSLRLADQIRELTDLPVEIWDESGSTAMASKHSGSQESLDAKAAAFILQDYLNAKK